MPDALSLFLVLAAVGVSWNSARPAASWALASAGLLAKPFGFPVFLLCLLHTSPLRHCLRTALWAVPAMAVALAYLTLGLDWLRTFSKAVPVFGTVRSHSLWGGLAEVAAHPSSLLHFL